MLFPWEWASPTQLQQVPGGGFRSQRSSGSTQVLVPSPGGSFIQLFAGAWDLSRSGTSRSHFPLASLGFRREEGSGPLGSLLKPLES